MLILLNLSIKKSIKWVLFMTSFIICNFCFAQSEMNFNQANQQSGYFNSFDGTKIYYEIKGEGRLILLIHGFIVNSESWKKTELYADLLKNQYKVILLDMRGNGKSDKPQNESAYANDAEAKDIIGLMQFLKIKKYGMVGYSRGAIIAMRVALKDQHANLAVIGGMDTAFTNPNWSRRISIYHALNGDDSTGFEGLVEYVKKTGFDRKVLAYLQKYQPSCTVKQLKSIRQPFLVIKGTEDDYNPSSKMLAKLLRKARFLELPGDHDKTVITKDFSNASIQFFKEHHY